MNFRKKSAFFLLGLFVAFIFVPKNIWAAGGQYPNISGDILFESRSDRITSSQKKGIANNNSYINIEPHLSLNINKNWSAKTDWRFSPFYDRSDTHPERFRQILSDSREVGIAKQGLYVEQLKAQFENQDMRLYAGKFNPTFGSAWKREKRLGIFVPEFTRDYEFRGKVGFGGAALLEKSEINFGTFFNDVSSLSNTGGHQIGREPTDNNVAGNTSSLSSYSVTMDGKDFFDITDLSYNFGYSHLKTKSAPGRDDQNGYVGGLEYLIPSGFDTYFIPFVEFAKIDNLGGEFDRNALYATFSLAVKYSNWRASVARVNRNIRQKNQFGNIRDHQTEFTVGYKFRNGIAVDVSRMSLREDGYNASLIGVLVSYMYRF